MYLHCASCLEGAKHPANTSRRDARASGGGLWPGQAPPPSAPRDEAARLCSKTIDVSSAGPCHEMHEGGPCGALGMVSFEMRYGATAMYCNMSPEEGRVMLRALTEALARAEGTVA